MEFSNRGQQPVAAPGPRPVSSRKSKGKLFRAVQVSVLVAGAILVGALAYMFATGGNRESGLVDGGKYQAVFLNGGQVYFGKVKDLNNKYLVVENIYYLRVSEQAAEGEDAQAQQDISLAKLGCELHGPEDKMVINRDQVTFWENLKDDGQVAKAIAEFVKQNPDGQKCADNTQQQQQPTGTQPSNN